MRTIRNILLIILALMIQSTFFGRFDLFGVRPDFSILVLILIVNSTGPAKSVMYGFLIGFLQDVYTPEFLGYNALSMSVLAFLLDVLKERLTVENYAVRVTTTFFAVIVHDIMYMSLYTQFDPPLMLRMFISQSFPGAVYTSVLAMLFIGIWEWMSRGGVLVVLRELAGSRR